MTSPRAALAVTGAAVFAAYLDITVVNVALPSLASDLDVSLTGASWVVTSYAVAYTALLVTAGRIADSHGRRRVFVLGVIAFGIASALCAVAWDLPSLVAFRLVQGAAGAVLVPVSLALLLPAWPVARRGAAIGAWGSLGALSAALGPFVGGALSELESWRLIFLLNVPLMAVTAFAARRVFEETALEADAPVDRRGIALLTTAIATATLAIVQLPEWGFWAPQTLALLATAAVAGLALIPAERRAAAPVLDGAVLRIRSFAVGTVASVAFYFAFFGHAFLGVLTMQGAWGFGAFAAGSGQAVGPLLSTALAPGMGRLVDRFGARTCAITGLCGLTAAFAWFALGLGDAPAYSTEYLPPLLLAAVSLPLAFPALTAMASAELPEPSLGAGIGVLNTLRQVGGVLGVATVVALLDGLPADIAPYREAYAVLACAAALAAVLASRARGR